MKNRNLTSIILLAAVAASCSTEEDINGGGERSDAIRFRNMAPASRSAQAFDFTAKAVIPLVNEEDADTLYLNLHENAGWDCGMPVGRGTPAAEIATGESFAAYCIAKDATRAWSYMNNVEVSNTGSAYEYTPLRYWPGADYTLDFYAYFPYGAQGATFNSTDGVQPTVDFIVPSEVSSQPDLMIASVTGVKGDFNQVVGLEFKHLLSQVKFMSPAEGELAQGTLMSVALTGVRNSAKWNGSAWTLNDGTTEMTLPLGLQYGNGQDYGTGDRMLMMLPQNLDGVGIKVNFNSAMTGEKTYTADLSGVWEQGKSYSYTITISPEYTFEIAPAAETLTNGYIDAHYDNFMVKVTPKYIGENDRWTISCGIPEAKFIKKSDFDIAVNEDGENGQYELLRQGYWIDKIIDANNGNQETVLGSSTVTFTGIQPQELYVYVPENVSDSEREIPVIVTYNDKETVNTDVKQYAPYWDGSVGGEHFDTSDSDVWGFAWTRKVTYTRPNQSFSLWEIFTWLSSRGRGATVYNILNSAGLVEGTSTYNPPISAYSGATRLTGQYMVNSFTIDYSTLDDINGITNDTDGRSNTVALINHNGVSEVLGIEETVNGYGWTSNVEVEGKGIPQSYAALSVARKCNKWNVVKRTVTDTSGGSTATVISYTPNLPESNLVWYLPASGQCAPAIFEGASGTYWTSTADQAKTAKTYIIPGGASGADHRMDVTNKVRAVRSR